MKLKLRKADRQKQDIIQQAIRRGLPLVGLFAATTLAAGTSETAGTAIDGDLAAPKTRQVATPGKPATGAKDATGPQATVPTGDKKLETITSPGIIMPPVAPPLQLPKETATYVVKSGDTFNRIAKTYRISPEILKELNHFTPEQAARLQVGQKIVVPKIGNRNHEAIGPIIVGKTAPTKQK